MTKTRATIFSICIAMLWAAGCEKQQDVSSDVNLHRLISAENRELKQQIQDEAEKREEEVKNLRNQHQAEMKKRDDDMNRLAEKLSLCEQAKEKGIKAQQEEKKRLEELMTGLTDWNTNLVEENNRLKEELSKIKGQN